MIVNQCLIVLSTTNLAPSPAGIGAHYPTKTSMHRTLSAVAGLIDLATPSLPDMRGVIHPQLPHLIPQRTHQVLASARFERSMMLGSIQTPSDALSLELAAQEQDMIALYLDACPPSEPFTFFPAKAPDPINPSFSLTEAHHAP